MQIACFPTHDDKLNHEILRLALRRLRERQDDKQCLNSAGVPGASPGWQHKEVDWQKKTNGAILKKNGARC